MYQIKLNGHRLKTEVNTKDVLYWQTRLAKMFPKSTIKIVRGHNERKSKSLMA